MKSTARETEEPPSYSDLDAWREIAAGDGLRRLRPEDEMLRLLRQRISTSYRNHGNDAIESAHDKLIVAVLKPNSADGKGLREAFRARVNFRADDAIVAEIRENSRYTHYETTEDGETVEPPDRGAPDHVEQVASRI